MRLIYHRSALPGLPASVINVFFHKSADHAGITTNLIEQPSPASTSTPLLELTGEVFTMVMTDADLEVAARS